MHNKKLFNGWHRKSVVTTARHLRAASNILAGKIFGTRRVSAHDLISQKPPTLLQHHKLHPNDKKIWDAAYHEEYKGLEKIGSWELITEDEYQSLRSILGPVLPTIAISTIKRDENGNPQRAKYRICVLGNLELRQWTKDECFAPVLSMPDLRFIVNLAVKRKRLPKTGDVSQAFCQSYLPCTENYVIKPTAGDTLTPKGMYLRLKKTLYGLKRSPRHWYEKAKSTLISLGLKQSKHSPCVFHGPIVKGELPVCRFIR